MRIKEEPSTNAKQVLLGQFLKGELFNKVFTYALDPNKTYGIKSIPKFGFNELHDKVDVTVETVFEALDDLVAAKGTSEHSKNYMLALGNTTQESYYVLGLILTKDLKCGVGSKMVNNVLEETIATVPYMRCSGEAKLKNIKYPAFIQDKADGMFAYGIMEDKYAEFRTRNNKRVQQLDNLLNLMANEYTNTVAVGELVCIKDGKVLDRKTSNGILNSCLHGTATPEQVACVHYNVWDILPLREFKEGKVNITDYDRFNQAELFVTNISNPLIKIIPHAIVKSFEEANDFYLECRKQGKEGAVLKNFHGTWKNHTSPNQIKLKNISEAELRITGWEYGKQGTKYAKDLGVLICETECEQLLVKVGSGFSDEFRKQGEAVLDALKGQIAEILFESVITSKSKEKASLFLPRFARIREDKSVADTLKHLIENKKKKK